MNVQIFGIDKCFDTKKTQRYFKERKINFQFIDLTIKGISKGELQSIKAAVGLNHLINSKSKAYSKLYLSHIISPHLREDILLKNPNLYRTPIVRNGKQATVGYEPEIWKTWE